MRVGTLGAVRQGPQPHMRDADHALVFFGGVGNMGAPAAVDKFHPFMNASHAMINLSHVAEGYRRHVLRPNHPVDIFIHSWSVDAADAMRALYRPVAAVFEPNHDSKDVINSALHDRHTNGCWRTSSVWCPCSALSMALSMQRALRLVERHENETGRRYPGLVMVTRPDLLHWRRVRLDRGYATDRVTLNSEECTSTRHHCGKGDYRMVMNSSTARRFSRGFDWIRHRFERHRYIPYWGWISSFVRDAVTPGVDAVDDAGADSCMGFEVYRRLCEDRCVRANVSWNALTPLGLRREDVVQMQRLNRRSLKCCPLLSATCPALPPPRCTPEKPCP